MNRPEFQVHLLNEDGINKAKILARDFSMLLNEIISIVGTEHNREMSIVKTKLEEASFFAKKALANQTKYQKEV